MDEGIDTTKLETEATFSTGSSNDLCWESRGGSGGRCGRFDRMKVGVVANE